jgi:ADP-ribosylation factor protein 6
VIDSSDKVRIDEARQELHRIINDREMKESLLLVFANKQDIPGGTSFFPSFPLPFPLFRRNGMVLIDGTQQ